jgi:hypothetical protein
MRSPKKSCLTDEGDCFVHGIDGHLPIRVKKTIAHHLFSPYEKMNPNILF